MKLALVQMMVDSEKTVNLERARAHVKEATENGADMVVLPEIFCCDYRNSALKKNCEPVGGMVHSALSEMAKENGVYLVGGSMPESDGDKIYNTSFVFDREGKQIARHRKMHLFDINIPGKQVFFESKTLTGGEDFTVFDTEFGRVGLIICFDIRFPELSRVLALKGAELIICPAAFNMNTGPAHWELMFRARSVENQIFMAGCSPARDENGTYISYGNSIIMDPWGDTLARADASECIIYADLDKEHRAEIQSKLPMVTGRRADLYEIELLKQKD